MASCPGSGTTSRNLPAVHSDDVLDFLPLIRSNPRHIMTSMCPPAPKPKWYNWNRFKICNQISLKLSERNPLLPELSTAETISVPSPSDPFLLPPYLCPPSYSQEMHYCYENKQIYKVLYKTEASVSTTHCNRATKPRFICNECSSPLGKEPIFKLPYKSEDSDIAHKIVRCRSNTEPWLLPTVS